MILSAIYIPGDSPILFPGLGLELNPPTLVFPNVPFLSNIHWYGLIIAVGLLLAVVYASARAKKFGLTEDNVITLLLWAVPAAILCARIYYCVFNWEMFRDNPVSCLYIWQGGIAIYGAIIGAVIACVLYCRGAKVNLGAMMDLGALGLLIGQSIGRWGNFVNREAFGAETESFLRMGLTDAYGNLAYYHPTFLYESLWNALGFLLLHLYSKHRRFDGEVFTLYVAWYGLGRFFIEGLRTDSLYIPGTGIRVSQMVGIVSFLAAAVFLLWRRKRIKAEN